MVKDEVGQDGNVESESAIFFGGRRNDVEERKMRKKGEEARERKKGR